MKPPLCLAESARESEYLRLKEIGADGVLVPAPGHENPFDDVTSMEDVAKRKCSAKTCGLSFYLKFDRIVYEDDLSSLRVLLKDLATLGVDGVFCADETVGLVVRSLGLSLPVVYDPVTLVTSSFEASFSGKHGFSGIVASSDLSFQESIELALKTEVPVGIALGHVPMYRSKRRLLQAHDKALLKHQPYALEEETRPNRMFPIAESDRETMILRDQEVRVPAGTNLEELPFAWVILRRAGMDDETYFDRLKALRGLPR